MNTVDKLIKMAEQQARGVLLVLHQSLVPTWVILAKDGQPYIRATPWKDDKEKELIRVFIREELRKHKARAYSFLTEAWLAAAPSDWDPETPLPEKDRASNQADRKEVVIAFATDGHRSEFRSWFIRRDWNEQVIALELADDYMGEPEGWMADLLK